MPTRQQVHGVPLVRHRVVWVQLDCAREFPIRTRIGASGHPLNGSSRAERQMAQSRLSDRPQRSRALLARRRHQCDDPEARARPQRMPDRRYGLPRWTSPGVDGERQRPELGGDSDAGLADAGDAPGHRVQSSAIDAPIDPTVDQDVVGSCGPRDDRVVIGGGDLVLVACAASPADRGCDQAQRPDDASDDPPSCGQAPGVDVHGPADEPLRGIGAADFAVEGSMAASCAAALAVRF